MCQGADRIRLTDEEIIDFFRYGDSRQLTVTRQMVVLLDMLNSYEELIIKNTFTPYNDSERLPNVESILIKTLNDAQKMIREYDEEYRKLKEESRRIDTIRQAVNSLAVSDHEILQFLYGEKNWGKDKNSWDDAAKKFHMCRSAISRHRRAAFQEIRERFAVLCKEGE